MTLERKRPTYAVLIAVVILLGLGSRSQLAGHLPAFLASYAGDTLWALLVFLGFGLVFTRARTRTLALCTLGFAFAVEFSQLYQADWINSVRDTRIGGLVLGFGFKWSDLLCYTCGCLLGVAGEVLAGTIRQRLRK